MRTSKPIAKVIASFLILFICLPVKAETFRDPSVAIDAVPTLDLNRYQGRWFEIARFPFFFERDCYAVTADYSLRENGRISVLNQCAKGAVSGPMKSARGEAWQVAPGKLKVSFVPIPILKNWVAGDYWVLGIDPEYSVAVIGSPKGSTGWILARQPKITDDQMQDALTTLRRFGYDTEKLIFTEH